MTDDEIRDADAEALGPLRARVPPDQQAWWLGCDAGWWPLMARLADDLSAIDPGWTLSQAKEKFGSLRFYAAHASKEPTVAVRFADRIAAAERESMITCERCGEAGDLRRAADGNYKTLCAACTVAIGAAGGGRYLLPPGDDLSDPANNPRVPEGKLDDS